MVQPPSERPGPHSTQTITRSPIQEFNDHILALCNCFWRAKLFTRARKGGGYTTFGGIPYEAVSRVAPAETARKAFSLKSSPAFAVRRLRCLCPTLPHIALHILMVHRVIPCRTLPYAGFRCTALHCTVYATMLVPQSILCGIGVSQRRHSAISWSQGFAWTYLMYLEEQLPPTVAPEAISVERLEGNTMVSYLDWLKTRGCTGVHGALHV
jgi:hypothetical protein